MQTFLPLPDFRLSAEVLDYRRLGKQRVEADQIVKILNGQENKWSNHPTVKMWRGYKDALIHYRNLCIEEWISRGFNNTMPILSFSALYKLPWWFGMDKFHASHRSNLLRKDGDYYGQFGWSEGPDMKYYWPI